MVSLPGVFARAFTVLVVVSLFPMGLAGDDLAAASQGCDAGAPQAWFLGVVHDDALRDDFQKDVDNFESFLAHLAGTYCIPEGNAEILAFHNDYTRNGKTYAVASEANVVDRLQTFGTAARAEASATLFYFHSSHGIAYTATSCSTLRSGSLANLRGGNMYDCELGRYLNDNFADHVRMAIVVDCSLCGGFSDSLTAASGTVPDGGPVVPSGILGPNRIVVTGCAVTTECFGSSDGGVLFRHLARSLARGAVGMDGWTVPGFPTAYGLNIPQDIGPRDGNAGMSEWFFRSAWSAYASADHIAIQQQFRIKYGPATLEDDIRIL